MDRGYMGKILMVDLTTRDIKEEVVPDEFYEKYLSGSGQPVFRQVDGGG